MKLTITVDSSLLTRYVIDGEGVGQNRKASICQFRFVSMSRKI